jgi:hypothetical protein
MFKAFDSKPYSPMVSVHLKLTQTVLYIFLERNFKVDVGRKNWPSLEKSNTPEKTPSFFSKVLVLAKMS